VKREDYVNLITEIEGEVLAAKRFAIALESESDAADVLNVCRITVENREADLLAAKRLLKRQDLLEKGFSVPTRVQKALPQSVGERLKAFLETQTEPFTVKEAAAEIKNRFSEDVTESAVAQALRRMLGNGVFLRQDGKGPIPAFFQRTNGAEKEAILTILNDEDGLGKTMSEIGAATHIIPPKVISVLHANQDLFVVGTDNLWRKKGRKT
jgi:hypothetical protein